MKKKNLRKRLRAADADLTDLRISLLFALDDAATQRERHRRCHAVSGGAQDKNGKLKIENSQLRGLIDEQNGNLEAADKRVSALQRQLESANRTIATGRDGDKRMREQLAEERRDFVAAEKRMAGLVGERDGMGVRLNELDEENGKLVDEVNMLKSQLADAAEVANRAEAKVEKLGELRTAMDDVLEKSSEIVVERIAADALEKYDCAL